MSIWIQSLVRTDKQPDLQNSPNNNLPSNKPLDEPMETDFAGPPLQPQLGLSRI